MLCRTAVVWAGRRSRLTRFVARCIGTPSHARGVPCKTRSLPRLGPVGATRTYHCRPTPAAHALQRKAGSPSSAPTGSPGCDGWLGRGEAGGEGGYGAWATPSPGSPRRFHPAPRARGRGTAEGVWRGKRTACSGAAACLRTKARRRAAGHAVQRACYSTTSVSGSGSSASLSLMVARSSLRSETG